MKPKLFILSFLTMSLMAVAGGSPSAPNSRKENPLIVPSISAALPAAPTTAKRLESAKESPSNVQQDSATTSAVSQTPLFSKQKLRELKKEYKDIRSQQKGNEDEIPRVEPLAVASFVCGLSAYLFSILALGFPLLILLTPFLAILGIVFGAVALGRIKRNKTTGTGFSLAGLILGSIFLFMVILIMILIVSLVSAAVQ